MKKKALDKTVKGFVKIKTSKENKGDLRKW